MPLSSTTEHFSLPFIYCGSVTVLAYRHVICAFRFVPCVCIMHNGETEMFNDSCLKQDTFHNGLFDHSEDICEVETWGGLDYS